MANRKKGGTLLVPRIKEQHAVGALGAADLGSTAFTATVDRPYWAASMDVIITVDAGSSGDQSAIIGVAHSDYSAAEIEEWIEATGSWSSIDKVQQEKARRKCRIIGVFRSLDPAVEWNDGKLKRIKLGFMLETGTTLQLFVYNDSQTVFTTGAIVELTGKAYLAPR